MDLFGKESEVIRTLGFYQPFGSLMLHGKIETRWVRVGKKPPFPLGKYLLYTTQKRCDDETLLKWCGRDLWFDVINTLKGDPTKTIDLDKTAIAIGELVKIRLMVKEDERDAFVKFIGTKEFKDKNDNIILKSQWCLEFCNVNQIEPFEFNFGKQGVGILPESEKQKIKIINHEVHTPY